MTNPDVQHDYFSPRPQFFGASKLQLQIKCFNLKARRSRHPEILYKLFNYKAIWNNALQLTKGTWKKVLEKLDLRVEIQQGQRPQMLSGKVPLIVEKEWEARIGRTKEAKVALKICCARAENPEARIGGGRIKLHLGRVRIWGN